ncbi:MAG: helix-turn-helix transcriptional regulator [Cyanobacteria bacterium J06555_13]
MTMATILEDKLAALSPDRQQLVEQQAQALIAEERALQSLRKLLNLTQAAMADRLDIAQEGVSCLEQRQALNFSTLLQYIKALGGTSTLLSFFSIAHRLR